MWSQFALIIGAVLFGAVLSVLAVLLTVRLVLRHYAKREQERKHD
jgi:uncharacterized protein (DUF2062 family)